MENLPPFNIADYIHLSLIAVGALQGLIHGLAGELARMVSVVLAVNAGVLGFGPISEWITDHTRLQRGEGFLLALHARVLNHYERIAVDRPEWPQVPVGTEAPLEEPEWVEIQDAGP